MTIGQNAPENMGVDTGTVPVDLPGAEVERRQVGGLDQTSRSMSHHIGSGGKLTLAVARYSQYFCWTRPSRQFFAAHG